MKFRVGGPKWIPGFFSLRSFAQLHFHSRFSELEMHHCGTFSFLRSMKIIHALPPVSAALVVGLLLWQQRSRTMELEDERALLQSTVAQAQTKGIQPISVRAEQLVKNKAIAKSQSNATAKASPKLTLADLLATFQPSNGMPDVREALRIQAALETMPTAELQALISETVAANLNESQNRGLLGNLLSNLGKKDPKLALDTAQKFPASVGESNLHNMGNVFREWAAKDFASATAWLDDQTAAGAMESTSLTNPNKKRILFETNLLVSQLINNPAEAQARFAKLSLEDRKAVITKPWDFPADAKSQQGYVSLLRSSGLSEKSQSTALVDYSGSLIKRGGINSVTALLNAAKPSPEETTKIVESSATQQLQMTQGENPKSITAEKTAAWRNWILEHDPANAATIIGTSLSKLVVDVNFEANVTAASPPEHLDAIKEIVIQKSSSNSPTMERLANSIQDENLRTKALEALKQIKVK